MFGDWNHDMFSEFFQGLLEDAPDDLTVGQVVEQLSEMGVKDFVKTLESFNGMFRDPS